MRPVEGVLLDVDGTLIDSNDAHAHAWVKALEEAGVKVPFKRVRRLIRFDKSAFARAATES
jgi:beta-phosphoglucomutase-like phosphatase (HAD superfamily)